MLYSRCDIEISNTLQQKITSYFDITLKSMDIIKICSF